MIPRSELKNELMNAGIRPSVQRLAIYEFVKNHPLQPTADVVYAALRDELGSLSLTTVYNTLKLFAKEGVAKSLNLDEKLHFDANMMPHAHFICSQCRKIHDVDIPENVWNNVLSYAPVPDAEMQINFRATCHSCLENN